MKIHPNIIQAVQQALKDIFSKGQYADDVVRNILQSNPKWGSRDRRFIAQAIYTIVRWKRKYICIACIEEDHSLSIEKIVGVYLYEHYKDPQGLSFAPEEWDERVARALSVRAIEASIPDWMDQLGAEELGPEQWEQELAFLNKEADVYLRVNTIKRNPRQVIQELAEEGIEAETYGKLPETLRLQARKPLQRLSSYLNGAYEIQDAGSQQIIHFLKPAKDSMVVDACAGAGGKSLHLAAFMSNKGKIIAMDVEAPKLKELERRATRAGATILETKLIGAQTIQSMHGIADYLLLDVPCSGIGVLRRNPDDKWKLSISKIHQLQAVQQEILQKYSSMLKPGGVMVYATCSILPSENEKQIKQFLLSHPEFALDAMQTIYPSQGGDGFFMARLLKSMK